MKTYKCDDALASKDDCSKAMSRLEQAKKDDDVEDDDFSAAKTKIEAALKTFDDGGGGGDGDGGGGGGDDGGADMSARTCRGETVELAAKSSEGKQVWIQIARQGKFAGHAAGEFEMNAATFSEIIHNFNAQQNRAIPVDFEHASEQSPTSGSIPTIGAPAQGWLSKLEMRSDGNLWGLVQWGELAKSYIKSGQYRYLSPAIVFGSKDRVTGKPIGARLSSVALTNNPFLDGMQPIAAKHKEASAISDDVVKAICTALELPAYAKAPLAGLTLRMLSDDPVERSGLRVIRLRETLRLPLTMSFSDVLATAREACGEILLTNIIPPTLANIDTQKPISAEKKETHMGDQNKEKELETQVSQLTLKLSAAESEKKTLLTDAETRISQLTLQNTELQTKLDQFAEREVTQLVDNAIQVWGEKRGLTAESRPHLMRIAKNDREGFAALYPAVPGSQVHLSTKIAAGPHNVPVPNVGNGNGGGGGHHQQGGTVVRLRTVIDDASIPDVETLAMKLMTEAKTQGISLAREEAYAKAHPQRIDLINAAASKRLGNGA